MTDRLTLTRALEGSGMESAAAERIASEIYDAIHNNVASKTDLRELEQRLDLLPAMVPHPALAYFWQGLIVNPGSSFTFVPHA